MEASMPAVTEITHRETWHAALSAVPDPHVLQSWDWGQTKAQTGWRAKRLLWLRHTPSFAGRIGGGLPERVAEVAGPVGAPVAAAAMLTRRLHPLLPLAVSYVPKGPLLDWSDIRLAEAVLSRLETEARRGFSLLVKVDPNVRADTPTGDNVIALLRQRGWRPSAEQIQYRNTMVSDLSVDESVLLAAMKPKWRYNIRLAERRGIVIRDGSTVDLPHFYDMYLATGMRDGFLVRPFAYYQTIWEPFLTGGLAHMFLAEDEFGPVAGLILFRFGSTAWYFYGASTSRGRDRMPNHALQWAAIRWARAAGCTRYDWWGAPDTLDENDPMWGVYRFKVGFGGEFVPHIGAWDYPASRPLYWTYMRAMPRLLEAMRRRHRASTTVAPGPYQMRSSRANIAAREI